MSLSSLQLKDKADRRLKKGHLWIYSNEIDTQKTPLKGLAAGEQVAILGERGKCLGVAMVNPNGLICARLVSRDEKPLGRALLVQRIEQALALRERLFAEPYYRLIYGDSDWLPGLVVDRFGDVLVVQMATAGMDALQADIAAALQQVLKPAGILFKNDHGARALEELPERVETVGEVPERVLVRENGVDFEAPVFSGQKTGWFYDHRENRRYLQPLVAGKRVLDVFSYIGGWGIQAAVAGASEVLCVDASSDALDAVAANAERNGLSERVAALEGKAQPALKALLEDGERFDVVVMDPPAFIKRKKDQKAGEAAYYHLNELAMRLLNRDGLLVSASCSMHLPRETLTELLRSGSRHIDRQLQIFHQGGQGPDHPVHPAIPETDYLKAQFARVFR
ncbi:class I SAM-dependent rRNA methyltransferase [Halioxenophilus sp. WMMB6]|uniref:class I SAM-dependent rRNA methyltransferase n=1 Tax=Halioxenophilus sp. WMMB6 TaxID=3073815 RepID=UPI00295F0EB1|nr:class I SAM-dependent rRNA methyltransferase [Halioxenophilus sp. WMMB6]